LLKNIDDDEIHRFFHQLRCKNSGVIVFDITSLSFYGEQLNTAEFGYNRNGDHLPQVNLCLAMDESETPVYFRMINGSVPDVSTVKHTVDEIKSTRYNQIHLVFDCGFYSEDNIKSMSGFSFTGALPKRLNLFAEIVRSNIDIGHPGNAVM